MNKRNLARIVTWESLITAVLSLVLGLALGIVLSKLAELGLVNMLGGDINYRIRIDVDSLTRALGLYAVIFAVIWLSTVVRVGRSSAVALLRSESVGEKPPKANWLLGLAGVVILAAAYYLAVSITNPLDADRMVLRGCDPRHHRHISSACRRQRVALPRAAEE